MQQERNTEIPNQVKEIELKGESKGVLVNGSFAVLVRHHKDEDISLDIFTDPDEKVTKQYHSDSIKKGTPDRGLVKHEYRTAGRYTQPITVGNTEIELSSLEKRLAKLLFKSTGHISLQIIGRKEILRKLRSRTRPGSISLSHF